jgi:CDP-glycerol glycerophosphotransferase (TagB/SpsB family)
VSGLVLTIRIVLVRAAFAFGRLFPLRSRVVLATAHAPRLGGNLVAIADDLAARRPQIPVVTLAHRPGVGGRGRIAAAWQAVVAGYYLATSRVFIVDDYFFPIYVVRPRAGTTIVQTWHACGAFKKVGYSVLDKSFGLDEALASRVRIHSNYDVCLVASQSAAPAYAEAFRQPLERFRSDLGIPRTDVFFGEEHLARTRAAVRERYGLTHGRRVILYAPTFRGDSVTDARATDDLDLKELQAVLGDDHVLLVRLHPFIRSRTTIGPELAGFAIDVSDHPDINELMLVSDVLVTDYSSAIFEFALLGRPMVFFAPDYEANERERGFYFDYRTGVPGPIFETTEALAGFLRAGVFDLERVERFRAASFDVADGGSATRVTEILIVPSLSRAGERR